MQVKLKGPASQLEAEARKKFITEKQIKEVIDNPKNKTEVDRTITRLNELLSFYDRLVKSLNSSLTMLNKKQNLDVQLKKKHFLQKQERDLHQAKRERHKFKNYLLKLKEIKKGMK